MRQTNMAGTSLIELLVVIIVLGLSLGGVMMIFVHTSTLQPDIIRHGQARLLGESIITAIGAGEFNLQACSSPKAHHQALCQSLASHQPEPYDMPVTLPQHGALPHFELLVAHHNQTSSVEGVNMSLWTVEVYQGGALLSKLETLTVSP